jgi:hypothetical protein
MLLYMLTSAYLFSDYVFLYHSKFILLIFSEIMISKCLPRGATLAIGIWGGQQGDHDSFPGREKRVLSSPKNVHTRSGAHVASASYSMATVGSFCGRGRGDNQGVKLVTHIQCQG